VVVGNGISRTAIACLIVRTCICSDRYTNFARSRISTGSRTGDQVCDLAKVRDLISPDKGNHTINIV